MGRYINIIAIVVILIVSYAPLSYCQKKSSYGQTVESFPHPDSLRVYHEKMESEETWEKIVNFPGRILFTPFQLTFWGAEEVAEHVVTPKVVQRIVDMMSAYKPNYLSLKYSSRNGAGLAYNQRNVFTGSSKFDVSSQWGLKNRYRYRMRLTGLKLFSDWFSTDFVVWHRFLSDESFYGLGNNSKKKDESDYGLKQTTAEIKLNIRVAENIMLNSQFGVDVNSVENGRDASLPNTTDQYEESFVPGIEEKSIIARIQFELRRITLNKLSRPTAGGIIDLKGGLFKDFSSNEFGFWKFSTDYKHYLHLFRNRTVSIRIAGERTDSFSDKKVPFYYITQIGSEETIRGYTRDRFRDRDMVLAAIEYSYHIYKDELDALVFFDSGQVSNNIFKDFSLNDFHTGYGAGLTVWGSDRIAAQALVGISNERVRYYFTWNKHF